MEKYGWASGNQFDIFRTPGVFVQRFECTRVIVVHYYAKQPQFVISIHGATTEKVHVFKTPKLGVKGPFSSQSWANASRQDDNG